MATTAQATGTPSTVRLCGKDYRIRPLIERDLGEFVLWCQDRTMALACRSVKKMDEDDAVMAEQLINHAHDEAAKLTTTHPAVLKMMLDMNGVAELLWYMIRTFEPQLAYTPPPLDSETPKQLKGSDAIRAMLLDPETLDAATRKYEQLNTGQEDQKTDDPFAMPYQKRRRRKRKLHRT